MTILGEVVTIFVDLFLYKYLGKRQDQGRQGYKKSLGKREKGLQGEVLSNELVFCNF